MANRHHSLLISQIQQVNAQPVAESQKAGQQLQGYITIFKLKQRHENVFVVTAKTKLSNQIYNVKSLRSRLPP